MITRETVAKKLGDYLHGDLALNELVDWSENSIADEEFEDSKLMEIVARLGLADVRALWLGVGGFSRHLACPWTIRPRKSRGRLVFVQFTATNHSWVFLGNKLARLHSTCVCPSALRPSGQPSVAVDSRLLKASYPSGCLRHSVALRSAVVE